VQSFWASSADDVWAVTEVGRVLHFDGAGWQQVHEAPRSGAGLTSRIDSIFGTGPDDIWITGFRGLIEHYDGQVWTNVRARDDHSGSGPIAGSPEQGLWTFLTNYEGGSEEQQVLRLRDGEWQVFSSKATAEDELMDLWVTDQGEVWVVGREIVRLR
jgi:hypothetical protein